MILLLNVKNVLLLVLSVKIIILMIALSVTMALKNMEPNAYHNVPTEHLIIMVFVHNAQITVLNV